MNPLLLLVGAIGLGVPSVSAGAAPNAAEMEQVRQWVAQHLLADSPRVPFSFAYGGGSSRDLLPKWQIARHEEKPDAVSTRYRIRFADPNTGLVCECVATVYAAYPAVEWVLQFRNEGTQDLPILQDIRALDLEVRGPGSSKPVLHRALGDSDSTNSFKPVDQPLEVGGDLTLAPKGGRSSDGHLPFFNLSWQMEGVVTAIGWSGQWQARFSRTQDQACHVQAGMEKTYLRLYPGETIRSPRILLVFWKGDDSLRGNNLLRQVLMAHYLPRREGRLVLPPICASIGEVAPDGSYEGPHVQIMPALKRRDIEVFWSDMDPQQWYPGGFPKGTGTWEPDPVKYPRGLGPVGQAAHAAGLGYLLWFEPERVAPGTRIDRQHPEWVMKPDKEWSRLFRLHDEAARRWLTDHIDAQMTSAQIDWLRWDFNIAPLGFWRRNDPPDRQGITEIRHIEGLYAMWDELRRRHPGLVVDNCASGGRRIDLETLIRGLPLWHSDLQCKGPHPTADQLQNGGLTRWVPLHGCGNFDLEPSYTFRSAMTAGNILTRGSEKGLPGKAGSDIDDAVKRTVALYKRVRPFMLGDFYPLFPHSDSEGIWYGYQYHRPDFNAGVAFLFRRTKSTEATSEVKLFGLQAGVRYRFTSEGGRVRETPAAQTGRIVVEIPTAPDSSLVFYEACK